MDANEGLEKLYRVRLAAVPTDEGTLGALLWMFFDSRRYQKIVDVGKDLPPQTAESLTYRLYRAEAAAGLGKMEDALARADELVQDASCIRFYRLRLAAIYSACDQKEKAVSVVKRDPSPVDHLAAAFLAGHGDKEGARAVIQRVMDRQAPGWVLMECVDACRTMGDEELARKVFDAAEQQCIREFKSFRHPLFEFTFDIYARYVKEGKQERLLEMVLPLETEEAKQVAHIARFAGDLCKEDPNRACALFEKHLPDHREHRGFLFAFAGILRQAGRYKDALSTYEAAESKNGNDPPDYQALRAHFDCYLAAKEYSRCEEWLKARPKGPTVNDVITACQLDLHRARVQADKAAETRPRAGQPDGGLAYLSSTQPASAPQPTSASTQAALRNEIARFRSQVVKDPNAPGFHAWLGIRLILAGATEEGRQEVRKAVELGEGFLLIWPLRLHRSCLDNPWPDGPRYLDVVGAYYDAGLRKELEADLGPLIGKTRAHKAAHLEQVACYLRNCGKAAEAATALEQAKALNPYIQ